jgi:hypothetical protein
VSNTIDGERRGTEDDLGHRGSGGARGAAASPGAPPAGGSDRS